MNLLDTINSPADLKKFARARLPRLAGEIREKIVEVVSCNGGHLASSLGAVELAIAIHYVFNTPDDKLIWDVGHQAYAHKLLTGRRAQFKTLRKYKGISGFCKITESPYDAFSTGHSSTSISAGLGIASAKKIKKEKAKVISVIGDGSLTAGLAFEGLNQSGDLPKDKNLLVILNDNDMSIAPNVGALSSLLSRKLSANRLQSWKKEVGEFLKSLPKIGDNIYRFAKRSEDTLKAFITPGILFEAFNFDYFGPIDGHNLNHLIDILENIKTIDEPVLLHIITKKGKGYALAEKNPVYYHGIGSFNVDTGKSVKPENTIPSYTDYFGQAMVKLAGVDKRIIAVTAAMPEGTGLANFSKAYPERFFDVGIAEQHGVTFAAGLALEGLKPVVAIYSTFLQRAYDQVLHDVCFESIPVVFALDRGGLVGEDGATHNGLFDYAYLRSLPNMVVMAPKDENELCRMLVTALKYKGPIAFRYPRGSAVGVMIDDPCEPIPIGKGEILEKGGDLLILAIGASVQEALKAHQSLIKKGIDATIINCRFVKPMDSELIVEQAGQHSKIITVEEHVLQGGFGSAVLECLNDHQVTGYQLQRIGIPDIFVEHGPQQLLKSKYRIDAQAIIETAIKMLSQ